MSRRGFTLLEVTVALAVLAVGVTAVQRLVARSVATVADGEGTTRALLAARAALADAELTPPSPGTTETEADGLRVVRDVVATPHLALREVHVRVTAPGAAAVELLEVIRVPPP